VWRKRRLARLEKYRRTKFMMPTLLEMGIDPAVASPSRFKRSSRREASREVSRHSRSRSGSGSRSRSPPPRNWTELAQQLARARTPAASEKDVERGGSGSRRSGSRRSGRVDSVRSYRARSQRSGLSRVGERSRSVSSSRSRSPSGRRTGASPPVPVPEDAFALAADRLLNNLQQVVGFNAVATFDPQAAAAGRRYPPGAPAPRDADRMMARSGGGRSRSERSRSRDGGSERDSRRTAFGRL
jgi:hypothetical protein